MAQYEVKDSGKREEYESGMIRDVRDGKGRYDLISPFALRRLALIYEKGAKKYSDRNWEKGAPFSRFVDSAMRHIQQWIIGDEEEDHLAQASWNLFSIMHLQQTKPDFDDFPLRKGNKNEKGKELKQGTTHRN